MSDLPAVPDAAITAAETWAWQNRVALSRGTLVKLITAAAPHIAAQATAAERERIRRLAIERDAKWQPTAMCNSNCSRAPHPYPHGPRLPFADLLDGTT